MTTLKTINRGWLKRRVTAGKVVCVDSYSYDEMTGTNRSTVERPVTLAKRDDWGSLITQPGVISLDDDDFRGYGSAYQRDGEETIVLHIHSNRNYTLKVLP